MPTRSVVLSKPEGSLTLLVVPPDTEETARISVLRDVLEADSSPPVQGSAAALASVVQVSGPWPWGARSGGLAAYGGLSRVGASGLDTCPGSVEATVGRWEELCSASLLVRAGLSDQATVELLVIVAGVTPLVKPPTERDSGEVVGLTRVSKGTS